MARFEGTTTLHGYKLRLDVNETSTDPSTNTSVVSWALYIVNGDARFAASKFNYEVTINGSKRAEYSGYDVDTTDVDNYQPHYLTSGTYTIDHNNDGSKTIYCSASCSSSYTQWSPGSGSCGGDLTLTTLNRSAKIDSFSGNDIDTDFSIGYTKYVNDWTYYLTMMMTDNTQLDRVVYNTSGTIYRLPEAAKDIIYNKVGNNDTVDIKAKIETYNGGTKIGESSTITNTCNINRNVWVNVNGTWKRGIPHVKVNGEWKKGIPYIKINGEWKKAI